MILLPYQETLLRMEDRHVNWILPAGYGKSTLLSRKCQGLSIGGDASSIVITYGSGELRRLMTMFRNVCPQGMGIKSTRNDVLTFDNGSRVQFMDYQNIHDKIGLRYDYCFLDNADYMFRSDEYGISIVEERLERLVESCLRSTTTFTSKHTVNAMLNHRKFPTMKITLEEADKDYNKPTAAVCFGQSITPIRNPLMKEIVIEATPPYAH